jgi:DNA-binding protein HU-beta
MNKVELIDAVSNKTGLSKKDTKDTLESILEEIKQALVKRDTVSFIGFGTFSTAHRDARVAKVPGTNRDVNVPATTVAKFKVGKSLKEAVAK